MSIDQTLTNVQFRRASPHHSPEIANTISDAIPPIYRQLTIYGLPSVTEYIRENIEGTAIGSDTVYFVATSGSQVIGAIEIRLLPDSMFLNQIAVAPLARGNRIGQRLLFFAIDTLRTEFTSTFYLDVLDSNPHALGWYTRLGFATVATRYWTGLSLDVPVGASSPVRLIEWARSQACHKAFGFSQLTVDLGGSTHTVGRLGRQWYRLPTLDSAQNQPLVAFLQSLEPQRRFYSILPVLQHEPRYETFATTLRMKVSIERLAARLETSL